MTIKFEVEKFDGKNDFSLWCVKMHALLVQQGLSKASKDREASPTMMFYEEKDRLMEKVHNVILLCLGNKILRKVAKKDTIAKLWLKLKNLYVTKSLTNCLYFKKWLFTL